MRAARLVVDVVTEANASAILSAAETLRAAGMNVVIEVNANRGSVNASLLRSAEIASQLRDGRAGVSTVQIAEVPS